MDNPRVAEHIANLKDKDHIIRRRAVDALGQLGDASAVPALIQALGDETYHVRCYAAIALGKIGDVSAMPDLIRTLRDEHASVRQGVVKALGELRHASAVPVLIEALERDERVVQLAAAGALWKIGSPAIPALSHFLRNKYYYGYDANLAWDAVRMTGDPTALPMLLASMKDTDSAVRFFAVRMLAHVGDASVAPLLMEAMQDEHLEFCRLAAEALGEIGDTIALPILLEALQQRRPQDQFFRDASAQALLKLGDSTTLPRKILSDPLWSVQERIDLLESLRSVRYSSDVNGIAISLHYRFPDTITLCQAVLQEKNSAAHAGAQEVLQCLLLLRGSQPDTSKQSQQLVRAVSDSDHDTPPETLLHPSQAPEDEQFSPVLPTFWKRLFGKV